MKRFAIFLLIVFAAATFYISCGESNNPEQKLEKLKKAANRNSEQITLEGAAVRLASKQSTPEV